MGAFWTLWHEELASRCLHRPNTVDGNYWGVWVPVLWMVFVLLLCNGLDLADVHTLYGLLGAAYLFYLIGNAARLGAKTAPRTGRAASSLARALVKVGAAGAPLAVEAAVVSTAVIVFSGAPAVATIGYLQAVVWTCTAIGFACALRDSSAMQATSRAWVYLGLFLMLSSFAQWAAQSTGRQPLIPIVVGTFNPLYGWARVITDPPAAPSVEAAELMLYAFFVTGLAVDICSRLQPLAPGRPWQSSTGAAVPARWAPSFILMCLGTSLLWDMSPLLGRSAAQPSRSAVGIALLVAALLGCLLAGPR